MNQSQLPDELKRLEALIALALARGAAAGGGASKIIRIPIALVTTSSAALIPVGVVLRAFTDVVTPYTAGTTISLGTAASPQLFQATSGNDPQIANLYDSPQDTAVAAAAALRVTITGGPVAGAGFACVEYAIPLV